MTGTRIFGAYIGTTTAGDAARPNTLNGVFITSDTTNTFVGGTGQGQGNVISGNGGDGVRIEGSSTQVVGNTIGLQANRSAVVPNQLNGIYVSGSNNTIGAGTEPGRNIIAGNEKDGIRISGGTSTEVVNNIIGTNPDGAAGFGNFRGISVDAGATTNTIGDALGALGNVISGNNSHGVFIKGATTTGTIVAGNRIGVKANGETALGNGGDGVYIEQSSGNTIGGAAVAAANVIGFNSLHGVSLGIGTTNNTIRYNYIGKTKPNNNQQLVIANVDGWQNDVGTNTWLDNDHD